MGMDANEQVGRRCEIERRDECEAEAKVMQVERLRKVLCRRHVPRTHRQEMQGGRRDGRFILEERRFPELHPSLFFIEETRRSIID